MPDVAGNGITGRQVRQPSGRAHGRRAVGRVCLTLLAVLATSAGCGTRSGPAPVVAPLAPAPDGFYRIRYGDTLSEIAQRRGIGLETLAGWNRLERPYPIEAGRLLRIEPPRGEASGVRVAPRVAARSNAGAAAPGRDRSPAPPSERPSEEPDRTEPSRTQPSGSIEGSDIAWQWPLQGSVVQSFRAGDRTRQGIRIAARPGQWVAAAAAGQVVYSGGGLKGYGNLIIIKHDEEWLSAYGLNRKVLISKGSAVQRGQTIAAVGAAPNGIAQLHFEIRRNGAAVDPLEYLPRLP